MLARTVTFKLAILAAGLVQAGGVSAKVYKHVATFSVDGLHSSDVGKYLAVRPQSTIAKLLNTGFEYTDTFTSAPSDSFPGTLAQFTGALPRTTGVWYDDIWDRIELDETLDFNLTELFSGGINPANLPKALVNGKCTGVFPHQRVRVNTVWEVVHSKGKDTAYADKHPAYDLVRGPSGKGLSVGYFPEIASQANTVDATIAYDQLHVDAFLDWLDGKTPANSEGSLKTVPTLFGGNFQSVSVGQKTVGYLNASGNPFTPELLKALDFVDASLGKVVAKLESKSLLDDTLIIVASKHGQAPIDPTKFGEVDPAAVVNATGVPLLFATTDDIALLFMESQRDLDKAVDSLNRNRKALKISDIISGPRLTQLGFGDPKTDPAVPDIIVTPEVGIIYTTSKAKIAEHGGLSDDDRKVACFVSNPQLKKRKFSQKLQTKQVAPTILKALGFDPSDLKGVVIERTEPLPGF
ncbi:type I phosphodiesterase/nucleotide pyrophosphatase [Rickenella mellea]|uniref:Type I phosphodiesterase/nucleotide pyrophosphatase n=1 Tax=Rickenella mellea TaxID=50990 RepID=A0A4Y7QA81_9AGAM|nr:type I phosphodiesterase/nucleotide pyrophosphatase [Rickenella mellea]